MPSPFYHLVGRRLPNSLLARTFFLLAVLVLATTTAWLSLFRYIDAEPRARETATFTTSAINLIRASLFAANPAKRRRLLNEFATREGIRLLPAEPEDRVIEMPDTRFIQLLHRELAQRLGAQTRIAASVDDVPGFWVSFRLDEHDDEEYWLVLPSERAHRTIAQHWLSWAMLATALALGMAWLIASRISRPLKAMARAADTLGRGGQPPPLREEGAVEIRQLASAFNTMASDLARHEQERSEVLAGISHDLRTPLTRLRLEAEMSLPDESTRQAVVADIEQMEAVISQFMDYARTESGEAASHEDISALIASLIAHQEHLGRHIEVQIDTLPPCTLRPKAMRRALTNLIENAWKYGSAPVSLHASVIGHTIQIDVCDSGPGIPPDERERLKRPFTRLETARTDTGGTGLGLAIVERVARLHGGRLDLLSNPGGGLIARLYLPISR